MSNSRVIIGKLIPAGTGMKRYRNAKLSTDNDLMGTMDVDVVVEEESAFVEEIIDDEDIDVISEGLAEEIIEE